MPPKRKDRPTSSSLDTVSPEKEKSREANRFTSESETGVQSEIVNIKSADRFKKVLLEYFSQWWILILHDDRCCGISFYFLSILFLFSFNVITFNFISFYLGVLRDGNPVAGP